MTGIDYAEIARLARKGRKAEQRGKAIGRVLTGILYSLCIYLIRGFFLMIGVGVVHHEWLPQLPTVGYWTAFLVVALLAGVLSAVPPMKKGTES